VEASFPIPTTSEVGDRLKHPVHLPDTAENLQAQYVAARPFPHLVLDGLFSEEAMEDLLHEIPSLQDDRWVHHEEKRLTKSNLRSAVDLGEIGYQHLSFLHSAAFLYLLAEVTGIWHMVPDPYLSGAGYHVVPAGGRFDVHADRNVDHNTGLTRRLAMITYLNRGWRPEYGGQLELWSKDASRCEVVVEPLFNRTILFEVADQNFHGVRPVEREGMERNSFAIYFHTVGLPDGKTASPHNSIYAPTFYRKRPEIKHIVRDCIPPILLRGVQKVRGK
jgi:Rps23 Pro-64 3,4-dihydroxylase Tpa1-like proline 4-hydroxylase